MNDSSRARPRYASTRKAQRQDYLGQQPVRAQQCIGIRDKEVRVLEIPQQREIGGYAQGEARHVRTHAGSLRVTLQHPAHCKIEDDAAQQ